MTACRRDRDAEHERAAEIDAVLQPQHLEFVLGEFAGEAPLHLIAEFETRSLMSVRSSSSYAYMMDDLTPEPAV
jgi:hypothetical protein